MANQKTQAKPNFFKRAVLWVKNLGLRIGRGFRNMFFELKKVTWPSKRDMVNYCIVFAFMIVMGLIIGLFDLGASALVDLIIS